MDLGLKDATAVVVGGGRGMGFATARCLADEQWREAFDDGVMGMVHSTQRQSVMLPAYTAAKAAVTSIRRQHQRRRR